MSAAIAYLLFAISSASAPDLNALAAYPTREACVAALGKINDALAGGESGVHLACISSDSLEELGRKNDVSAN
jgi:hypothetical protein